MTPKEFSDKYLNKTYIGDGLYVNFDGCYFVLTTERENGVHWVGLEESVLQALLEYRKQLYEDSKLIEDQS